MRFLSELPDDIRWQISGLRNRLSQRARARWGWVRRIAEILVSTLLLAGFVAVLILVRASDTGNAVVLGVCLLLVIAPVLLWTLSTARVLRSPAMTAVGFLAAVLMVSFAPVIGPETLLRATGRTAACQPVSVQRMPEPEWNGDRWRHQLLCPDGTSVTLTRADSAVLAGPLRYDPRDRVEAQPSNDDTVWLVRSWLALLALMALQTLAALVACLIGLARSSPGWDAE